jgi:hypothetical protein
MGLHDRIDNSTCYNSYYEHGSWFIDDVRLSMVYGKSVDDFWPRKTRETGSQRRYEKEKEKEKEREREREREEREV